MPVFQVPPRSVHSASMTFRVNEICFSLSILCLAAWNKSSEGCSWRFQLHRYREQLTKTEKCFIVLSQSTCTTFLFPPPFPPSTFSDLTCNYTFTSKHKEWWFCASTSSWTRAEDLAEVLLFCLPFDCTRVLTVVSHKTQKTSQPTTAISHTCGDWAAAVGTSFKTCQEKPSRQKLQRMWWKRDTKHHFWSRAVSSVRDIICRDTSDSNYLFLNSN